MESYMGEFSSKLALYAESRGSLFELIRDNLWLIGVLVASSTFLYYCTKYTYWLRRGIKGPFPIPPFGTVIYELIYSRNRTIRAWSKKYGQVYGIYQGTKPILVVSHPEIIRDVMVKDAHLFPNHTYIEFGSKWQNSMLFFKRDEQWKELRSLMAFSLTSGKIKKMFTLMNKSVDDLIKRIHKQVARGEKFDVKHTYACFTLDTISRTAFAMKFESNEKEERFRSELVRQLVEDFSKFPAKKMIIMAFVPKFILRAIGFIISDMSMQTRLAGISKSILDNRRKDPTVKRNDFVQLLMDLNTERMASGDEIADTIDGDITESHHVDNYDKQELKDALAEAQTHTNGRQINGLDRAKKGSKVKLNDNEIIANCILFFIAGFETTSSLLSFATYALACHPDIQERLYREVKTKIDSDQEENPNNFFQYESVLSMEYLDATVSESLRMFPPAPSMDREAATDYKIKSIDLDIPRGSTIWFAFMSLHYNSDYHPNPYKFEPSRFLPENRSRMTPNTYVPFGAGIRHCLGMRFALAEAKLALARLVYEFKFVPVRGSKAIFPPRMMKTFRSLRSPDLEIKFEKR